MGHTPGPWTLKHFGDGIYWMGNKEITGKDGKGSCYVGGVTVENPEDATLICAAPGLLSACEGLLGACVTTLPDTTEWLQCLTCGTEVKSTAFPAEKHNPDMPCGKAVAAIRKAEGGAE